MEVKWQCEIDPFCRWILNKHWPDIPCYEDVCAIKGDNVERVDLLCGGFPCQDISVAGRGAGIQGKRSGLWFQFARLIRELRPSYAVIENVPALKTRGLNVVLADLAACGYDAEWDCIPASAFGAPHKRERLWIVAYPSSEGRREVSSSAHGNEAEDGTQNNNIASSSSAQRISSDGREPSVADSTSERLQRRVEPQATQRPQSITSSSSSGEGTRDVSDSDKSGRNGRSRENSKEDRRRQPANSSWWESEPNVGRVADGIPNRVDRIKSLGNSLVPQIATWIGEKILEREEACQK